MYTSILNALGTVAGWFSFLALAIIAIALVGAIVIAWLTLITLFHKKIKHENCRLGLRLKRLFRRLSLALGLTFAALFLFVVLMTGAALTHLAFPIVTMIIIYWLNFFFPLFIRCTCCPHGNCTPACPKMPKGEKQEKPKEKTPVIAEQPKEPVKPEPKKEPKQPAKTKPAPKLTPPEQKQEPITELPPVAPIFQEEPPQQKTQSITPVKTEPVKESAAKQPSPKPKATPAKQPVKRSPAKPKTAPKPTPVKAEPAKQEPTPTQPKATPASPPTTKTVQLSPTHTVEITTNQTIERTQNISSVTQVDKREAILHADGTVTGSAQSVTTRSTQQLKAEQEGLRAQYDKLENQLTQIRDVKARQFSYTPTNTNDAGKANAKYDENEVKDALAGLKGAMDDLQRQIDSRAGESQ